MNSVSAIYKLASFVESLKYIKKKILLLYGLILLILKYIKCKTYYIIRYLRILYDFPISELHLLHLITPNL